MINIGVEYIELHWHYWLGFAVPMIINIILILKPNLHHDYPFLYFVIPGLFGASMFFIFGIMFYYAGWVS